MDHVDLRRPVAALGGLLLVLTFVHDFDHARQGRALDPELYVVGALAVLAAVTVLVLALRREPLADYGAVFLGVTTLLGVAAVHVAPRRSTLSDSYGAAHVDALSWLVIAALMAAGLALAVAGAYSLWTVGNRNSGAGIN